LQRATRVIAPAEIDEMGIARQPVEAAPTFVLELLLFNGSGSACEFQLPHAEREWQVLLDSAAPQQAPYPAPGAVTVQAHSVTVLQAQLQEASSS
jgi:pullulanase/glycogen debranching enzyme